MISWRDIGSSIASAVAARSAISNRKLATRSCAPLDEQQDALLNPPQLARSKRMKLAADGGVPS